MVGLDDGSLLIAPAQVGWLVPAVDSQLALLYIYQMNFDNEFVMSTAPQALYQVGIRRIVGLLI